MDSQNPNTNPRIAPWSTEVQEFRGTRSGALGAGHPERGTLARLYLLAQESIHTAQLSAWLFKMGFSDYGMIACVVAGTLKV